MTSIAPVEVPDTIAAALKTAARQTGAGFDYLVRTAFRESSMDSTASARNSSAVGLFQFVENTWMETVKTAGPKHGLGEAAAAITRSENGRYNVADPATRTAILALRTVPEASALMAGEFTRANGEKLESDLGRAPTDGELYIAHFLGAGGASQLIRLAATNPDASAAKSFPAAARANPSIFYSGDGKARSAAGVYRNLVSRHGGESFRTAVATPAETVRPLDLTPDRARAGLAPRQVAAAATMAIGYADQPSYLDLYRPGTAGSGQGEALVATLKAYGVAPAAAREAPVEPPTSRRPEPVADGARRWGRSLFTTGDARPLGASGSLFTTRTAGALHAVVNASGATGASGDAGAGPRGVAAR